MQNFIDKLQIIKKPNSNNNNATIISLQQALQRLKYPALPTEYLNFLYLYNGLSRNGGVICGIYNSDNFQDIIALNNSVRHPLHKDLLFLGYDDFDYLAYNHKYQVYQVIDKQDLEVLEEYADFSRALQYILKIDYE